MPRLKGSVIEKNAPAVQWRWKIQFANHVSRLHLSPDGAAVAVATLAGEVAVLSTVNGDRLRDLPVHPFGALDVAWSPDGGALASAGHDGIVRVVNTASGAVLGEHHGPGWASRVVWSNDGTRLAAAIGKDTVLIRRDGTEVGRFGQMPHTVTDLVWSTDDRKLGILTYGGVRWFGTGTPKPTPDRVFSWKGAPLRAAMSSTGKFMVHGNQDNSVHVWRMSSADEMEMAGYPAKVEVLAWDRTGEWLAVGTVGFTPVWDCSGKGPSGRRAVVCHGPERRVTALSWQRRGNALLIGSGDATVHWYLPTKAKKAADLQPLGSIDIGSEVADLHFLHDDRLFVVACSDGTVGVSATDLPSTPV